MLWFAAPKCEGETDMVFVLDASGSITEISGQDWYDTLELMRTAVENFSKLNPRTKFSLVVFSTRARLEIPLTGDVSYFISRLSTVRYDRKCYGFGDRQ